MADGSDLILSLPEDALALISAKLGHPRHLMALCLTSRRLYHPLVSYSSTWLSLASSSAFVSPSHLHSWHSLSSLPYRSICRFLFTSSRLSNYLYVDQNPELDNLVFSIWGFLSVVFVRIIPQMESKKLAFSPVMEIHCDADGAPSILLLHGEDGSIHAGSVSPTIPYNPTILLLEADFSSGSKNVRSLDPRLFRKLKIDDRTRLLDFLSSKSSMKLQSDLQSAPIFPRSHDDFNILSRRREMLISHYKATRGGLIDRATVGFSLCSSSLSGNSVVSSCNTKRENEELPLTEYLRTGNGDSIGLSLRATSIYVSSFRSWTRMHEYCYGLYNLHLNEPRPGMEFSGLWGGSYGWTPTLPGQNKSDKPTHLLLLYYDLCNKVGLKLIGKKVLEGPDYPSYPNGSKIFSANLEEPTTDSFPWETEMTVNRSFKGSWNPSSYLGSLFLLNNGFLAFVWMDTKKVLVLRRIDLSEIVANCERVPTILPAISNFTDVAWSY